MEYVINEVEKKYVFEKLKNCNEFGKLLKDMVFELPEDICLVLLKKFWEGKADSEIAKELRLRNSTVQKRVDKGLEIMRERILSEVFSDSSQKLSA